MGRELQIETPIDEGPIPSYKKCGFRGLKLEIPSSNNQRVVATAEKIKRSLFQEGATLKYTAVEVVSKPSYELEWVSNSFLTQVCSYDEINTFCQNAGKHCKESIKEASKYKVISFFATFFAFISLALSCLAFIETYYLAVAAPIIILAWLVELYFSRKLYKKIQKVYKELCLYIYLNKKPLVSKGVLPRPGQYGAFIEFVPT